MKTTAQALIIVISLIGFGAVAAFIAHPDPPPESAPLEEPSGTLFLVTYSDGLGCYVAYNGYNRMEARRLYWGNVFDDGTPRTWLTIIKDHGNDYFVGEEAVPMACPEEE